MIPRSIYFCCVSLAWTILTSGGIGHGADSTQPPTNRALLIGINRYQALPSLNGSLNDIETMRQVLTTRWRFHSKHITMLTDQAATRAGMLAAFEKLAKETGPEDVVYVHYSGHGSQVEDFSGDETDDHLDETLVPHDGRTASVPDITDDELDEIFSRLRARSVLIVLDSCHSGTATRSLDIRTRSVPKDSRTELYRPSSPVQTRQVVPVVASRYILMTGAAANQEALDGPVEGRYHGFFSYSLAKSIATADQAATPRDIFAGVERELHRIQTHFGRTSMPEPQLEAPPLLLDRPLLPSLKDLTTDTESAPARLPWVEVHNAGEETFRLMQSVELGAQPGSTWLVFPPNETAFVPGQALGVLVVSQIRGKDALAKPQSAAFSIPPRARAVAFLPAAPPERVPVQLLNVPPDRRSKIEEALRPYSRDVQIVESGHLAQYLIDVKENRLQLYSADGLQVVSSFAMDGPQWGAGLALVLSRSASAGDLLTLDNPASQLKLAVKIAGSQRRASRGIAVVADTQPAQYHIRRSGEPRSSTNSLQLEIQTTGDSYLTVVDVDSEGRLNLLFPNDHQQPTFYPEGRVRAGETVILPDSPENGNHAGFHWDYAAPAGTDTVRVFASTDLETAQAIRRRVRALPTPPVSGSSVIMARSIASKGVRELRHDLSHIATRGLSSIYDPTPAALTNQASSQTAPQSPSPPSSAPLPPAQPPMRQTITPPPSPSIAQTAVAAASSDWTATSLTIQVEP